MSADFQHDDYDTAIIGSGPAGLSAAIVLARSCRRVIVFDNGQPRNYAAQAVHCFLGADGITPFALRDRGRKEAISFGAEFCDSKVLTVERVTEKSGERFQFNIATKLKSVRCRTLLFATGMIDDLPGIPGLEKLYGRLVHHCPYCDGWEHRGKHLVALSDGPSAVELALSLRTWSSKVTCCSNGYILSKSQRRLLEANEINWRAERVKSMAERESSQVDISLHDGCTVTCDAVFFSSGQGQRSKLPQQLGCDVAEDGLIERDAKKKTCVDGVFVAGDAGGDAQLAVAAAAEGAVAAMAINRTLEKEDMKPSADEAVSLANNAAL